MAILAVRFLWQGGIPLFSLAHGTWQDGGHARPGQPAHDQAACPNIMQYGAWAVC